MKKVEFYCDCCGKKVNNDDDLIPINVFSQFKHMQDDSNPYDIMDLCADCENKIEDAIYSKFHEIKNKSIISNK